MLFDLFDWHVVLGSRRGVGAFLGNAYNQVAIAKTEWRIWWQLVFEMIT